MTLMSKMMEDTQSRENTMKKECEQLRSSITTLQQCIANNCNMQEENNILKQEIRNLEDDIKAMKKAHQESIYEKENDISDLRAEHDVQLADIEAVLKAQSSMESSNLQKI